MLSNKNGNAIKYPDMVVSKRKPIKNDCNKILILSAGRVSNCFNSVKNKISLNKKKMRIPSKYTFKMRRMCGGKILWNNFINARWGF